MEVELKEPAQEDILFWKKSGNKAIQKRIQNLIEDICAHPFTGIGKPEPLKYQLSGAWSRRINDEHRIVYEVLANKISILSLRGHY